MSDPHDPADAAGPARPEDPGEPVGSVGEEAAKLFGALSDWARERDLPTAGAEEAFRSGLHGIGEHLTGESAREGDDALGGDCRWCPVCQVVHVVRQTSPEVRAHLAVAASSLMQAAAGLLAPPERPGAARGPVEKIDLDDPEPPEERR